MKIILSSLLEGSLILLFSLLVNSSATTAQQLPRIGERIASIDSQYMRSFLVRDTLPLRSPVLYRKAFGPVWWEGAAGLLLTDCDSTGTIRGVTWIRGALLEYYSKSFLKTHRALAAVKKDYSRTTFARIAKALIREYGKPIEEMENSEISVLSWDRADEHVTLGFERGCVRLVKEA